MADTQTNSDLFYRYLEICNKALKENRDRFPFKQILGVALHDRLSINIEVCIIDDHPKGAYVMHLQGDKISGTPNTECTTSSYDSQWRVSKTYLEDVIAHPDDYIKNPARIDWDWLHKESDSENLK